MFNDGRILVTGGAGFIGSALVWGLNQMGLDRILIADRLDNPCQWRNLRPLRFEDYVDADELIARTSESPNAFGKIALILHLGACSSTTEQNVRFLMGNNYRYSQRIATWALAMQSRFVYASSAATYGALEGTVAEDLPPESLRPLNAYGYSKHLFDLWARRTGLLEQAVGLKYFNVFGPNEEHKGPMRSMVSRAYEQVRSSGSVQLFRSERPEFRDGEQLRDFLYVKDAVSMTLHLAANPAARGLYNLGSGQAHTWLDLVTPVFAACGLPPRIEFIDMPASLRGQYQYHTCASIGRLRESGYTRPVTPLDRSVADYVRGYLLPGRLLGEEDQGLQHGNHTQPDTPPAATAGCH
jgi:ADP-L-glycero-D-manno-heptose 6-epimerase